MPQAKALLITIISFFLMLNYAKAQLSEQENSPYSYFGPGDLKNIQLPAKRAMGGTGIASSSNRYINLVNPAALSMLRYASLHTGLFANAHWLSENNTSTNTSNTNYSFNASMEYLVLGLPITKWWGSSIGLLPYSTTNYNIMREVYEGSTTDSLNLNVYNFQGSGSFYKFQWANGFTTPVKKTGFLKENQIAFGVNADYYFGNRDLTTIVYKPNIENIFDLRETQSLSLNDFGFYSGLLYKRYFYKKINKDAEVVKEEIDKILSVGLTFQSNTKINAKQDYVLQQVLLSGRAVQVLDTVGDFFERAPANITLPAEFGIGINYGQPGSWQIEANFKQINWSKYKDYRNITLSDAYKLSIGTQFTPRGKNSVRNRVNTLSYRFGGYYYSNHIITANEATIPDFGLTFGLGIPVLNGVKYRRLANLNLSFNIGNRGNIQDNNVRETYFKTTLGITFNDGNWFIKRRYE